MELEGWFYNLLLLYRKDIFFLKIYKVIWWKPIFTVFLLPIYYVLSDLIYKRLQQQKIMTKTIASFFTIMVIETNIMYVLAYYGLIQFKIGKNQSTRLHFKIAPLYSLSMSCISTYLAKKEEIFSRIIHLYMYILFDAILIKSGILTLNRRQQK